MKYIIIGGVAGGASAAARLRRLDERAEILLFEKGEYISYANCGLPYYIGGVISDRERLFVQTPESFAGRFGIDVRVLSEVKKIDTEQKKVWVEDLRKGKMYEESFDKLVLSPGAEPVRPPLEGISAEGIFSIRNVADTDRIHTYINRHEVRQAVVIGGGFIGLEMAENLAVKGIEVTIVEMADQVMTPVDYEIAAVIHRHLREKGIRLRLKEAVTAFRKSEKGLVVELRGGDLLETELVVLSIGVRPDIRLARESGLEIGKIGGIRVNSYLQTSCPDIYAIGDAIEFPHPVSGKPALTFLAGPANKEGRICADNMVRGNHRVYKGSVGTAIAKVFELTVGSTGLSARLLKQLEIPYQEAIVHAVSHAGYYPGALPLTVKINFSPLDGRLLGGQVVGYEGADKRLEMLSAVMRAGGDIYALAEMEQAYAPPYSAAKDPVNMAGFIADNILNGVVRPIGWREVKEDGGQKYTFINVCTPQECELGQIPGSFNIPLDKIREHLDGIPWEKPVVVYCAVGLRGYIASRILMQNGFDVYNLTGGWRTYEIATEDEFSSGEKVKINIEQKSERRSVPLEVDACGLQCPGPVMKLKENIDRLVPGDEMLIRTTDPAFRRDVVSWAEITGNLLKDIQEEKGVITAVIEKGKRVAEEGREKGNAKTLIVFSDDLDKALASFVIANGAVAMGRKVTMFFTFWGLNVIKKANSAQIKKDRIGKMFGWMLPRNSRHLALSKMNMWGIGSRMMRGIMRRKGIESLENLMVQAQEKGVEFIACQMSMDVMGIDKAELMEGVKIGGVANYLEKAEGADMNLFI